MIKRLSTFLLCAIMVISLVACSINAGTDETTGVQATSAASAADTTAIPAETTAAGHELNAWAEEAGLDKDESTDELYELAKKEGKVVIYSISSRIKKVKESFEAAYPGVILEAYDISTNELLEKVTREYDSGIRNADVVHIKDQDGSLYNEYVLQDIFHNYYPQDIVSHIDSKYLETSMPLYIELNQWFYNDEVYKDGPPISSWWDLTKPEWKGKILMANPIDNLSYMSVMTGLVLQADALAEDYKRVFGEEIVLNGTENAGYELIKRLVANDIVYISSSSEMVEAVGTPGQTNPPIAFAASSKLREREEKGFAIQPCTNITPNTGIPAINTLYVVNECEHPNAAKLLIRFMLGETDGTGEGFAPFNTLGGWPVRDDITLPDGSIPFDQNSVQDFDPSAIYNKIKEVSDFWISIQ